MMYVMETSPFVLSYRYQYPWPLAKARRLLDDYVSGLTDQKPILRSRDVISMDVVVTAESAAGELHYLIGSHKLASDLTDAKVKRRITLERDEASDAGFLYFLFSRTEALDVAGKSAKQIFLWGRKTDFNSSSIEARVLGNWIYKNYGGESVARILQRAAQSLKKDVEVIYGLFSAAVNLGYLFLDISFPIRAWTDIQLIDPSEARPPWEDSKIIGHGLSKRKSTIQWAKKF
ncbi:PDDEXK family nuclease [Paraburkholderia franconis]|nr:hypothetical protein [Paraburkholderia franconis]